MIINKLRFFGLIFLVLVTMACNAQKNSDNRSSQMKKDLTQFLISKKILEETNDLIKYDKMIYITNLKDKSFIIDEGIGVYAVGASISHTRSFLLLKNEKKEYTFHEIENVKSLLEIIMDLLYKNPEMNDDLAVIYINNILNFYKGNKSKAEGFIKVRDSN